MKGDRLNSWLLAFIIVLVSVSIYNINTVMNGFNESYFKGLLIVTLVSMVLSTAFVSIVGGKTKAAA